MDLTKKEVAKANSATKANPGVDFTMKASPAFPATAERKTALFAPFDPRYVNLNEKWDGPEVVLKTTILGPAGASCPLLNSEAQISAVIDMINGLAPSEIPALYLDLEGRNLSKNGSIAIMQLLIHPLDTIFLVDVHTLGASTFSTTGSDGTTTFKSIFESKSTSKVFFDCRNDSNALSYLFGVNLRGVIDLQVMNEAVGFERRYLTGLSKAIEWHLHRYQHDGIKRFPMAVKSKGAKLFAPDKGGSWAVFEQRPLPLELVQYCAVDVVFMPLLWKKYTEEIPNSGCVYDGYTINGILVSLVETTEARLKNIDLATKLRVLRSQTDDYQPTGPCKGLSVWSTMCKEQNRRPFAECSEVIPFGYIKEDDLKDGKEEVGEKFWNKAMDRNGRGCWALNKWVKERY